MSCACEYKMKGFYNVYGLGGCRCAVSLLIAGLGVEDIIITKFGM